MIWVLLSFEFDPGKSRDDINYYSLLSLFIGIACTIFNGGFFYFFARVAEGLTYQLRSDCFGKILRMPVGWFDEEENNAGNLAVRL